MNRMDQRTNGRICKQCRPERSLGRDDLCNGCPKSQHGQVFSRGSEKRVPARTSEKGPWVPSVHLQTASQSFPRWVPDASHLGSTCPAQIRPCHLLLESPVQARA